MEQADPRAAMYNLIAIAIFQGMILVGLGAVLATGTAHPMVLTVMGLGTTVNIYRGLGYFETMFAFITEYE